MAYGVGMATDAVGRTAVVWMAYAWTGESEVWARLFVPDGGWEPTTRISEVGVEVNFQRIAGNPSGDFVVVWAQYEGDRPW
jgi:hypothetical protein